jgi:hypothetical protein
MATFVEATFSATTYLATPLGNDDDGHVVIIVAQRELSVKYITDHGEGSWQTRREQRQSRWQTVPMFMLETLSAWQ